MCPQWCRGLCRTSNKALCAAWTLGKRSMAVQMRARAGTDMRSRPTAISVKSWARAAFVADSKRTRTLAPALAAVRGGTCLSSAGTRAAGLWASTVQFSELWSFRPSSMDDGVGDPRQSSYRVGARRRTAAVALRCWRLLAGLELLESLRRALSPRGGNASLHLASVWGSAVILLSK